MKIRMLLVLAFATKTECPMHRNPIKLHPNLYHACTYGQSPLTFTIYSELPLNNRAHVLKVEYVHRYLNKKNGLFELVPPPASKKKAQPKTYPFQRTFDDTEKEGTVYHTYKGGNCGTVINCCKSERGCQDPIIKKALMQKYWQSVIRPQIEEWFAGIIPQRELEPLLLNVHTVLFQAATSEIGPLLYTVRCTPRYDTYTETQVSVLGAQKGGLDRIGDVLLYKEDY